MTTKKDPAVSKDERGQWVNKDGFYTIAGRCPHCGLAISIHTRVDMKKPYRNKVSPEQAALVKELVGKEHDNAIAAKVGVSYSYVRNMRYAMGFKSVHIDRFDDVFWKPYDHLFKDHRNNEIVKISGATPTATGARRFKLHIKNPRSEEIRETKLKIWQMHELGLNDVEIARAVRLTRSRIEQVLKGDKPQKENTPS